MDIVDQMTLRETEDYFVSWTYAPPTSLMLQSFLGWGTKTEKAEAKAGKQLSAKDGITDDQLRELSSKSRGGIKINIKDPGLPKAPPVFDENAMRLKNAELIARKVKERKNNGE
jgi:hypothetical protein